MIRTLLFFLLYVPVTLVCLLVGLPLSLLHRPALHRIALFWSRIGLFLGGVQVQTKGMENLPATRSAVFIANHQSNFDIPLLLSRIPRHFGFLAKIELFRIPLFNWGMQRMQCIPIDRANRQAAMASIHQAADRVKQGLSVMVFPEGTRTPDGRLLPFKKGGFQLAIQAGVPIVPIAIDGTFHIMAKKSLRITPGQASVTLLPPIETASLHEDQLHELITRVQTSISECLTQPSEAT